MCLLRMKEFCSDMVYIFYLSVSFPITNTRVERNVDKATNGRRTQQACSFFSDFLIKVGCRAFTA